jgi:hypothetical protein
MAVHTDTKALQAYNPGPYPTIPGGDAKYLNDQLSSISKSLTTLVAVVKLLEARMNTNGLT